MENTKHTPLPWKARESESKPAYNIVGTALGGQYKIARCPYLLLDGKSDQNDILQAKFESEAKANAELIVKAVNNHDLLLEALKDVVELIESPVVPNMSWILKRLKEALSKAGE